MIIEREIKRDIEKNLFKGKAIVIYGPRRVGKTTLVKDIISKYGEEAKYINCDVLENRQALEIQDDKKLRKFLGEGKIFVIDEAQRVVDIGLSLKILIDSFPDIQIIATGSSSFDLANRINEPLTGRTISFILYPISIKEIKRYKESASGGEGFDFEKLLPELLRFGSYPEIVSEKAEDKIQYLKEISGNYLFKDIFEFEGVKRPEILVKLLQLLAFQVGKEVSYNELAVKLEVNRDTVVRYIDLLEKAFVVFRLPPFARNLRNEIGKKNKIYFYDLGIRNAIISAFNAPEEREDLGALWENFCIIERFKFLQSSNLYRNVYFWRTRDKKEIDYVEEYDGRLYGYELKWGQGKYKMPESFLSEYKNSSVVLVNRSNAKEFLGII
ncbi:MAG: ATP-binding protein [Candidatus Paceibacterota bacterium]